jgi:hypothetical protein
MQPQEILGARVTLESMLERAEKILVAMYHLAQGTSPLKYEDIVVKAFELFPHEFALRGYSQYPDSSDIHKPLYGPLKRKGLVRSARKIFSLTEKGTELAKHLEAAVPERDVGAPVERLDRGSKRELDRMLGSEAFRFFRNGQPEKILDTDFYRFVGSTVRTPRNDFLGRVNATADAIRLAGKLGYPAKTVAEELANAWRVLQERFKQEIQRR